MNEKRYRAVLFDLGGTLRIALEDEPYMRHARRKMTELAGAPLQVEDFYQLVEDRYESYRRWALGENKEAGDRELWCRWLLPDYDLGNALLVIVRQQPPGAQVPVAAAGL